MSIYGRRPSRLSRHNITILHGMPHIVNSTLILCRSTQYNKMVIFSKWPNFQLKPRVGIYDWALAFIQGLCISSSVGRPPKAIHKSSFFTIIQAGRPYYIIEKNAPLHSNILTSIFAGRRRLFLLLLLLYCGLRFVGCYVYLYFILCCIIIYVHYIQM